MSELNYGTYYHENAPAGRIFNMDDVSESVLSEQGWVDSPAKLGISPLGGDPEVFAELRDKVAKGEEPRIGGDFKIRQDDTDVELAFKQNDKLLKELQKVKEQLETSEQKRKMQSEELEDMRSDAAKLKAKPRKATRRSGNPENKPVRGTKQKASVDPAAQAEAEVEAELADMPDPETDLSDV